MSLTLTILVRCNKDIYNETSIYQVDSYLAMLQTRLCGHANHPVAWNQHILAVNVQALITMALWLPDLQPEVGRRLGLTSIIVVLFFLLVFMASSDERWSSPSTKSHRRV